MKPAPFDYERPHDLQAALAVLGEAKTSTKIIAGGRLVPCSICGWWSRG